MPEFEADLSKGVHCHRGQEIFKIPKGVESSPSTIEFYEEYRPYLTRYCEQNCQEECQACRGVDVRALVWRAREYGPSEDDLQTS